MEDFGYQKDEEQSKFASVARKIFLVGATIFSLACFVYIAINAYYFVYQDQNSNIETIKSPEGEIKVSAENEPVDSTGDGMQIDRSIYEDIFGNRKRTEKVENTKIRSAPEPAIPAKKTELDRRLIKEPVATVGQNPSVVSVTKVEPKPQLSAQPAQKTALSDSQKIIVYSNQNTPPSNQPKTDQDLLTKTSGEEKPATKALSPTVKEVKSKRKVIRVQIAAMTSKTAAEEYWGKISRANSGLFSNLSHFTEGVDLGKRGVFYRLQVGNFLNQLDAEEFCNNYITQTQKSRADCIVVE